LKNVAIFSFVFAVGAALVSSASADIYSDCEDAISRGDDAAVQEMVSRIRTFGYVPMRRHTAANICVSEGMGREMVFQLGLGQFIPLEEYEEIRSQEAAAQLAREVEAAAIQLAQEAEEAALEAIEEAKAKAVNARICELQEVLAETNLTILEAEAAQQDRRIDTLAATIQECSAWFNSDPRSALTNDICNSIFVSGGLPNSEVSGPSTSEILLAELTNQNASTELEILIDTGMLLETLQQMAKERGISEDGDPYDCDE
jgi:predicted nucleic acid-binding protein